MSDEPSNAERIASTISPVDPWPALTETLERMEDDDGGQEPGREVDALLPGRKTYKRVKVHRIMPSGAVVIVHPKNGGLVAIDPERVRTVHYKQKLR